MCSNRFKVGILGGGSDSAVGRAHISAFRLDNTFDLVAGCFSQDESKNKLSASEYGISAERIYPSLDSLIQNEKNHIDAIIILSPTDQHFEQVLTCLSQHIPVICEKAISCSVDEARKLEIAQQESNGFLLVCYNYLGYPMLRELAQVIQSGKLGPIFEIAIEMPQEGFLRVTPQNDTPLLPQNWRLSDRDIPTVSLDLGVHLHAIVRFLTQKKPLEAVSFSTSSGNFSSVIDSVAAFIRYSDDMMCTMRYGKTYLGNRNGLKVEVFGKKGSACWIQEDSERLLMADQYGQRFILDRGSHSLVEANKPRYMRFKAGHPAGFIEAFSNFYYDAAQQLRNFKACSFQAPSPFSIDVAKEGLTLLATLSNSSKEHTWKKVP